ncbi:hypothetical protein H0G86_012882 [Trichoderma simmonsii]|uniref:Uncharacterized protein n=1 Tax=Trichoderma simmonsii TaxID=1491479 RepID=A0A8G0LQ04_9HYPO|nr:hypothetical protein H0G86_012882 [Trichoderma simmonsii]
MTPYYYTLRAKIITLESSRDNKWDEAHSHSAKGMNGEGREAWPGPAWASSFGIHRRTRICRRPVFRYDELVEAVMFDFLFGLNMQNVQLIAIRYNSNSARLGSHCTHHSHGDNQSIHTHTHIHTHTILNYYSGCLGLLCLGTHICL